MNVLGLARKPHAEKFRVKGFLALAAIVGEVANDDATVVKLLDTSDGVGNGFRTSIERAIKVKDDEPDFV
jgi:hypothetical protein